MRIKYSRQEIRGHDKGVRSPAAGTRKLDLSCIESSKMMHVKVTALEWKAQYVPLFDLYSIVVVAGRFRTLRIVWLQVTVVRNVEN